jgi:hypothetical protein
MIKKKIANGCGTSLQCRGCGRPISEKIKKCICGYDNEGWGLVVSDENGVEKTDMKALNLQSHSRDAQTSGEVVIKEIDSWAATFSLSDKCIYLGTPALQPFSLKLTTDDLEDLLEFAYRLTGREKTMRKLQLSAEELSDLVSRIQKSIQDKILKAVPKFSDDELQEIADFINLKLKQ